MSQFMMCLIKEPVQLSDEVHFEPVTGSFYQLIGNYCFHGWSNAKLFIPFYHNNNIDTLCIAAQLTLQQGIAFQSTRLFKLLSELQYNNIEFIMWYGDDFKDLDVFDDFDRLIISIKESLIEPSCESYVHFIKGDLK